MPRRLRLAALAVLAMGLTASPAAAITLDWVDVGDPGNACDVQSGACFGSVDRSYRIGKYEVTNTQYAAFLNAKAADDPLELYNPLMGSDARAGITRAGSAGGYTYEVVEGRENKPVVYVSFYDALRFANWIHNGQGSGDTENGAYTLAGGTVTPSNGATVTRNLDALFFLPDEDEWYKAAYYDAAGSYYDYPAATDTPTTCALPGPTPNTANCDSVVGDTTDVGSYTGSASPYGTFDQGGNVWEWNETLLGAPRRGRRGGNWTIFAAGLAASARVADGPLKETAGIGFRLASSSAVVVPEPGTALLLGAGLLALARRSRRPAR